MADDLVFKVKFDLQKGVDEALKDGDKALERIEKVLGKHPITIKLRMDNRVARGASAELTGFKKQLEELTQQWNSLTAAERGSAAGAAIREKFRALRTEAQGYTSTLQSAVKAEDKMRESHLKTAASANKLSSAYHNQSTYLSRLIKRMAVYASFRYVSNFLTNVREVTAQFELQRVSLGAIIQDQQKANQIFAEIKSFALTSPLKILDLTKYTKQVAAYGFETNKLFSTTKMLADISVGLGTDMSRLTLFLGQVYATGYLRASELRQATEAGIPLVDKLANKLEELNGRTYTAAEVMDMISKRAISYEMVEQVFKDMTSAGGEFYNMQVKQSQTLFGMWSKLGDAAAIMYDQIGNTSSINAGMKLAIRSIESMMRNWKTTARVLDSVAVATTVYIVGLKNAAIASKALTSAVALENLAHQQQIIRTPKIIAGIIGINKAKKISTWLTGLHTKAVLGEAAATNVLTKGFWKLTAAMLANPWVAAASAIALVGVALFHFIGNTETAAERAEKLNNSVASLKNLDDTTKPLIDTYNELINKTERTAEEQKKLSEVTHELAKQYPGAITAIGNFGKEVELAADKLNQLYQAEKQARMENTRHELEKTEQKITETEEKIARLQAQLQDGTKTVTVGSNITGYTQTVTVQMSDEDKGKVLKQIDELRYGEDEQSGLFGLQQSAEAARRALGLLPSEAAQAVEKFGAWKKTFTTFRQQVGDVRVQLFDDSAIAQFGSLEEALKKTAEEYKKNIALVATYDEVLKSTTLTAEERAKIEGERAEADAMATLAKKALDYYNTLPTAFDNGKGGRQSDPRLQNLKEEISLTKKLYDEYHKLEKQIGATMAAEKIQEIYSNTIKTLQDRAGKYGFTFELPFTDENLKANMQHFIDKMKELQKLRDKKGKPLFPNIGKEIDEAVAQLEDFDLNSLQKALEKKLKELSDRISRTKTAKEFYDKILKSTGDANLALNLTTSIYGENGQDLKKQAAEQVRRIFSEWKIDMPIGIVDESGNIDYKALRDFAKKAKETKAIGEGVADELIRIAENGEKELSRVAQEGAKLLLQYDEIAQKRVNIEQEASDKIRQLREAEAVYLASQATSEEKAAYSKRTDKAVAGIEAKRDLDLLKLQDEYMRFFSAIHSLTKKEAETLRGQVRQALFKAFQDGGISADELKRELKAIDEQFQKLIEDSGMAIDYLQGGFDGLIKRVRETSDELQSVATEISKMESPDDISEGQKSFIDKILGKYGDETTGSNFSELFSKANGDLKKMGELLGNVSGKIGGMASGFVGALAIVDMIVKAVDSTIKGIGQIRDQLNEMRSEDNQLEGGFWDAFEYLENFNKYAVSGWEKLKSGDIIGATFDTISSIISIFGTSQAQKVKRLNKRIEEQSELIEDLEYQYNRLQETAEMTFGKDYLQSINNQVKILEAQIAAYRKQAELERKKGKGAEDKKIKEYLRSAEEATEKLRELQGDLFNRITGTDVASAARDFAQSWLDASLSFGSTTGAIKEKFRDMIKNMVVESFLAKTVQNALMPVFDMIDERTKDGELSEKDLVDIVQKYNDTEKTLDDGLRVRMEVLKKLGFDIESLRNKDGSYTGIAKNIAGATSEEINTAAAIGNTLMYYVSPIPSMDENLSAIRALMERGMSSEIPATASASAGWTDWQKQAMDNYIAIQRNTAETVTECRRIAERCTAMASDIHKVIVPRGVKGSHGVQIYM